MPEHRNLAQPPTPGLRDWRSQMGREDALAFEQVAGDVLQSAGYELLEPGGSYPTSHGRRIWKRSSRSSPRAEPRP